jgi:hypothetical protein
MSAFPKFIIENIEGIDHLVIGNCTYHKQLSRDMNNIKGGGWWIRKNEDLIIIFHGDSHDFGRARVDDIVNCIKNKKVFIDRRLKENISDKYSFKYKDQCGEIFDL